MLLRSLEPLEGHGQMRKNRSKNGKERQFKDHELCNGPSKLTMVSISQNAVVFQFLDFFSTWISFLSVLNHNASFAVCCTTMQCLYFQALGITKSNFDQVDLSTCCSLWLEDGPPVADVDVVSCSRIGIDYAGEWVSKPLRFYVRRNRSVSIRDKKADNETANK